MVRLVVMDLDPSNPGHGERGAGQTAGYAGCQTAPEKRGMNPVSDFKPVRTDPSVQTAAAGGPPVEKYTEDYVASLTQSRSH